MDGFWGPDASKKKKTFTNGQLLHDSTYIRASKFVLLIEAESKMVAVQGWEEEGNREWLFNGYRVSVTQDGEVLEIYYTIMSMH